MLSNHGRAGFTFLPLVKQSFLTNPTIFPHKYLPDNASSTVQKYISE